jgi:hypothetical protein
VGVFVLCKEENLMAVNKNQTDVLKNLKRKRDLAKRKENRAKQTALKEKEKTAKYEEKIKEYENLSNDFLYYLFNAENEDEKQQIIHLIKACKKIEKREEEEEKIMSEFNSETENLQISENNYTQQLEFDTEVKTEFSGFTSSEKYENTEEF